MNVWFIKDNFFKLIEILYEKFYDLINIMKGVWDLCNK